MLRFFAGGLHGVHRSALLARRQSGNTGYRRYIHGASLQVFSRSAEQFYDVIRLVITLYMIKNISPSHSVCISLVLLISGKAAPFSESGFADFVSVTSVWFIL